MGHSYSVKHYPGSTGHPIPSTIKGDNTLLALTGYSVVSDLNGEEEGVFQVEASTCMLQDLPQFYQKSSVQVKRDVLGSIFPEKLVMDKKNVEP